MTFRDDNGNELQFDGDFAMTKQAVSFFNGSINGNVSITFQVDNNSVNRKVLNYQGPQMLNQVAFTKQAFNRVRDGNILDRGYIVIQSENQSSLNCFYVSGNSNWIQLLQGIITDLDYSGLTNGTDYSVPYTNASTGIKSRVSSTDGITFPLVDWMFNLRKGGGTYEYITRIIIDSANDSREYPLSEFYPCFYFKSLVSEIVSQNGLKISGNVLTDAAYNSLIITPYNGLMKRESFRNVYAAGSSQAIAGFSSSFYTSLTEVTDPEGLFSNNSYTANRKASLYFNLNLSSTTSLSGLDSVSVVKNGLSVGSEVWPATGAQKSIFVACNKGDVFTFQITNADSVSVSYSFNVTIETPNKIGYGDYISPVNFLPGLSSISIINFIIRFFGCSVYFDEFSKTITCNILEKIKPEDAYDWSEYYITHTSEYTVSQAKNNYIKWIDTDHDLRIKTYNNNHDLKFADGNIQTGNTLRADNVMSTLPFKPSTMGLEKNEFYKTNIPLVSLVDDGDPIPFTAITQVSPPEVRYTHNESFVFNINEVVRITNSNDVSLGLYQIISLITSPTRQIIVKDSTFNGTGTGFIRKQKIVYNEVGPMILSNYPNAPVSDYSNSASFEYNGTIKNWPLALFTKQQISKNIDTWKNNLSIDNPDSGGFIDPTIKERYFNKIGRFLQNPPIMVIMLLPEAEYQRYKFDQFIYLKTEKLTGYFFVDSIKNYVDSSTPVEVNFYML